MHEEMKERFNIWWKLTPVAAVLTVLTWFGIMYIRFEEPELSLWIIFLLYAGLLFPNIYLSTFSLWHWKIRYRGRWPFAWAIMFVLWWGYLPGLGYFLLYILPEMRGNDPYSKPPEAHAQPSPLPSKYRYVKSTCFIVGSSLLFFGVLWAIITAIAFWMMIGVCRAGLPRSVPERISADAAQALDTIFLAMALMQTYVAVAAVCAGLGGILLCVSQRMRWRLLDQKEKETLEENI